MGSKDSTFFVGAIAMAERGYEDDVGIFGMHQNAADLEGVAQAKIAPGFAGVGGFVDSIAKCDVGAHVGFSGSDVDGVGVGRRDGESSNGSDGLLVENGCPGPARVGGMPDSSIHGSEIIFGGTGDACGGDSAASAVGSDETPFETGERRDLGWGEFGRAGDDR